MGNGRMKVARDRSTKTSRKARDAGRAFSRALAFHQSGSLAEAQTLYKGILQQFPDHFDALHLLGVSSQQLGHLDTAERLIRRALVIDPRSAAAHSNLGQVLVRLRRLDEALASCDRAIALEADFAVALLNRGHVLAELSRFEAALTSYDRAIALKPEFAEAWNNRGLALLALRRPEEASASCDRAIALNPRFAEALNNRGTALFGLNRHEEALASYDQALAIDPHMTAAWLGRAQVLGADRLADAFAACHEALAIEPNSLRGLTLLGQCHASQGDTEQAVAAYDRALAIRPDDEIAMSGKIFALDFCADAGFAEHQAVRASWWQQIGSKIAARSPPQHDNDRDPARRIVLGYVSSDFRKHSAAFAFSPVLRNHAKTKFEVICYSCSLREDAVTGYFQSLADKWRNAWQWSDDRLVEQIRADKVDILIDLSGHTDGHRLGAFARKPAPIQVTAWGNATGTGLPLIDYLFSDPVAIPAAVRHLFAEKVYDLPCLVIIDPPVLQQSFPQPPMLSKGHMTYGVFNRINKISEQALGVWARIMRSDDTARLLIKHQAVDDQSIRLMLTERFARQGVSADRIDLLGFTSRAKHIEAYGQVDVCLDPFPQNGGVSTWEALHVGVPVVAKLGDSIPSRVSGAILSSIGMTEWVAASDDDYAEIALRCASVPDRLRTMRQELPSRIALSSGCGPEGYAKAVEQAYRTMWEKYCGTPDR